MATGPDEHMRAVMRSELNDRAIKEAPGADRRHRDGRCSSRQHTGGLTSKADPLRAFKRLHTQWKDGAAQC